MSISPFKGLKDKVHEINVNGTIIKVMPKVSDMEFFLSRANKKEFSDKDIQEMTKLFIDIIHRANLDDDKEDIASFVGLNYNTLLTEYLILFGVTTREQIKKSEEELKKKQTLLQEDKT